MRKLATLALLAATCAAAAAAAGVSPRQEAPIPIGDNRAGYERGDYRTDSRSLTTTRAVSADLGEVVRQPPLGLPPLTAAPEQALIDLGRRLFFDRRLSANDTLSCGMCHVPEQAFAQNELRTPVGIEGAFVRRNAPSLINVAYVEQLFHDGRESSLEQQIWAPLLAANEMGNPDRQAVLARVAGLDDYADAFAALFAEGVTEASLGAALAAYQRALLSGDAPFDRFYFGADSGALEAPARRGLTHFVSAGCSSCHHIGERSALFTDQVFHNTGVAFASEARRASPPTQVQLAPGVFVPLNTAVTLPDQTDLGRLEVTGVEADRNRFRTPSLRNVALTAPYMHDGSLATLQEVIAYYAAGGSDDPGQDPRIRPLRLDAQARAELLAFLEALTGANVGQLAADARTADIGDRR